MYTRASTLANFVYQTTPTFHSFLFLKPLRVPTVESTRSYAISPPDSTACIVFSRRPMAHRFQPGILKDLPACARPKKKVWVERLWLSGVLRVSKRVLCCMYIIMPLP